jgi:hypothetical protein
MHTFLSVLFQYLILQVEIKKTSRCTHNEVSETVQKTEFVEPELHM